MCHLAWVIYGGRSKKCWRFLSINLMIKVPILSIMLIFIPQEKLGTSFITFNHRKHEKWKWTYKPDIWPPSSIQKKRWNICKTILSDFGWNFLLLGGVFHKCSKSKYHSIHQNKFFGTHFVCEKHPFVFLRFPPLCMPRFLKIFHLPIFGELRKVHAKISCFRWKLAEKSFSKVDYFMIAFAPNVTTFP